MEMGLSEEDQKKSQELRLQVNGRDTMERSLTQTNEIRATQCELEFEGMSCCQANGNSPSCQSPLLSKRADKPDLNETVAKVTAEKKSKKQISQKNGDKGACTRKVCSMPTWFESREREDTYAALAVVGVAASVAFAYSCYKQLR